MASLQADNAVYPIFYQLTAIWDVLRDRREADAHWKARVKNFNKLVAHGLTGGDASWRPPGTWKKACRQPGSYDAKTGILSASCEDWTLGHNPEATLNYYLCAPGAHVENSRGMLRCDGYEPGLPGALLLVHECCKVERNLFAIMVCRSCPA